MTPLELLAPARNLEIGIAAIDCGADAVYIAGPFWGNRKDAGNSIEDIARLCSYAHKFGARIFLTVNTIIYECEMDKVHSLMLEAQEAGVDAFIFRDERLLEWDDIKRPMHASTQCAIRDVERAVHFDSLGCERIILERELSLKTVEEICKAVSCEVEFFVHGALCVCYSGECRLSEYLDSRSADRGECIQACRSLYDLSDESGRTLVKNKALLSLKDLNLRERLEDLAEAGVSSFKIEGRLKSASYVKNVVREYDIALRDLITRHPDRYCRASWGRVEGGFEPDLHKTFNRGYTDLWIDGKRSQWSSMDAPKSMGEKIGTVTDIQAIDRQNVRIRIKPEIQGLKLSNGDGFAFSSQSGVTGFRGDRCEGYDIYCKQTTGLRKGIQLWRNINTSFEKILDTRSPRREIAVNLDIRIHGSFTVDITARTEDGRQVLSSFKCDSDTALNRERAVAMLRDQMGKRSDVFSFTVHSLEIDTAGGKLPLLSASTINGMRRLVAEDISAIPLQEMHTRTRNLSVIRPWDDGMKKDELMRSKYCVKYELGMCPARQGAKPSGKLFLINNGRKFQLLFDCARCEMTVIPEQT